MSSVSIGNNCSVGCLERCAGEDVCERSDPKWCHITQALGQVGSVLPRFLTLYKPFGQAAALGLGALRTAQSLYDLRRWSEDGIQQAPPRFVFCALFEVAALAGTFFAHPVGMLLIAAKDVKDSAEAMQKHLEKGSYEAAMRSGAKVLSNALYLGCFATGGLSLGMASLALQVGLGLYQVRQAFSQGNYVEATAHLCLVVIQGRQLSCLASQMKVAQTSSTDPVETQQVAQTSSTDPVETQQKVVAHDYTLSADRAQYKNSDYTNAVRVERGISLEQAKAIADADPEIDYFFRVKGMTMVLEMNGSAPYTPEQDPLHLVQHMRYRYDAGGLGEGNARLFHHGDTVFFKNLNQMWLGTAPGLADTYVKNPSV